MLSICREHAKNVKRWRDGGWRCAGAPPGCSRRRSNSVASTGTCPRYAPPSSVMPLVDLVQGCQETGSLSNGPPPKFYGERDILGRAGHGVFIARRKSAEG